ncbi:hypothetical protein CDL15_Pgr016857 [Punica granatum]|uniref:Uncharacterized protein n=1 Tax=Punica granatum TaxID=22663 RepID=A0A218WYL6_PUNGR|nr:hypothetical protein CDL15_Pgr016857 [Punica granatum]
MYPLHLRGPLPPLSLPLPAAITTATTTPLPPGALTLPSDPPKYFKGEEDRGGEHQNPMNLRSILPKVAPNLVESTKVVEGDGGLEPCPPEGARAGSESKPPETFETVGVCGASGLVVKELKIREKGSKTRLLAAEKKSEVLLERDFVKGFIEDLGAAEQGLREPGVDIGSLEAPEVDAHLVEGSH